MRNINDIKVTIGLPVYNVEKYVEKSLLSTLNQNFVYPYEVLIIDDCGMDDSMKIVNDIISSYPVRETNVVRIFRHPRNKGIAEARNTIIREAKGKYIYFLDSDDWISEDCLSLFYNRAEKEHTDVVVGSFMSVSESGEVLGHFACGDHTLECKGVGVTMSLKGIDWPFSPWNKLYRTDFLRNYNFHFRHKLFEDVFFNFKMRVFADKISCINETTMFYLARDNSLTSISLKHPDDETIRNYAMIVNDMRNLVIAKSEVKGIYDFYMMYLRAIFNCLSMKNYSSRQKRMLNSLVKSYMSIVPSAKMLCSNTHKIIYYFR